MDLAALLLRARTQSQRGDRVAAERTLRGAADEHPGRAEPWLALAALGMQRGAPEQAIADFERALALDDANARAWHGYGWALAAVGKTARAIAALRKAVERDPQLAAAQYELMSMHDYQPDEAHLASLRNAVRDPRLTDRSRSRLQHALGRALEKRGELVDALARFHAGNRLRRDGNSYDAAAEAAADESLRDALRGTLAAAPDGHPSETPVFIVGLPRSGSTLLEQMLARHPDIASAGETPHFANALARHLRARDEVWPACAPDWDAADWTAIGAAYLAALAPSPEVLRVVDKQLFNYRHLGAIRRALPNAALLHIRRDPLDTCWSCYATAFKADLAFTTRLDWLGQAYGLYRQMMAFWHAQAPDAILDVDYERLVAEPEETLRGILRHIGIAWSDACLDATRPGATLTTASRGQAGGEIFRAGVGRGAKFAALLGDFPGRLRELNQ